MDSTCEVSPVRSVTATESSVNHPSCRHNPRLLTALNRPATVQKLAICLVLIVICEVLGLFSHDAESGSLRCRVAPSDSSTTVRIKHSGGSASVSRRAVED